MLFFFFQFLCYSKKRNKMDQTNDLFHLRYNHGHSHDGQPCHGHGHDENNHHGHSHDDNSHHGHSHGGQPCHGHGDPREFDNESYESPHMIQAIPNKFLDKSKYVVKSEFEIDGLTYVEYKDEGQMPLIMNLITKDLSEPYSIYTYRYFIHNWPFLCYLVLIFFYY